MLNLAVLLTLNAASHGLRAAAVQLGRAHSFFPVAPLIVAADLAGACADHLDRVHKRARSTKDFR